MGKGHAHHPRDWRCEQLPSTGQGRSGLEQAADRLTGGRYEKLVQATHVTTAFMCSAVGAAFCGLWYSLHLKWSALAAAAFALSGLASLLVLWVTRSASLAIKVNVYAGTLCCFAAHLFFGGGPGSAGMMAWCYPGALSLVVADPGGCQACGLLALVLLYGLATTVLEQTVAQALTPQRGALPGTWYPIVLWLNVNVPGLLCCFVAALAVAQLKCSHRVLQVYVVSRVIFFLR